MRLRLMDVRKPWERLLIRILWLTYPISYPTFRVILYARRAWGMLKHPITAILWNRRTLRVVIVRRAELLSYSQVS